MSKFDTAVTASVEDRPKLILDQHSELMQRAEQEGFNAGARMRLTLKEEKPIDIMVVTRGMCK